MEIEDLIYQLISTKINCSHLDVSGDGRHFDAIVVSDDFVGISRLGRHRMVYQSLGDNMQETIHALSLKLHTVEEWSK